MFHMPHTLLPRLSLLSLMAKLHWHTLGNTRTAQWRTVVSWESVLLAAGSVFNPVWQWPSILLKCPSAKRWIPPKSALPASIWNITRARNTITEFFVPLRVGVCGLCIYLVRCSKHHHDPIYWPCVSVRVCVMHMWQVSYVDVVNVCTRTAWGDVLFWNLIW